MSKGQFYADFFSTKLLSEYRIGERVRYIGKVKRWYGKILVVKAQGISTYLCKIPGAQCGMFAPEELEPEYRKTNEKETK